MLKHYGIVAPDLWFRQKIDEGKGIFDRKSFERCMSHVSNKRVALDIGAHYGTWSVGLAKQGFTIIKSFEPIQEIYETLELNTKKYNNIEIFNLGANNSKEKTVTKFNTNTKDNSGQNHIDDRGNTKCYTISLDSMFGHYENCIDFIKFDVEGYEYFAIQGAKNILKNNNPIIVVELNGLSKRYGKKDKNVIDLLETMGYKIIDKENKDYIFKKEKS